MTFAQGSRSELSYISEVTFGTTPATPSMTYFPVNTHTLNLTKASLESAEIRSDRQTQTYRHGDKMVSGDLAVDFRADDYDPFLESAFFGTMTTAGVLKVGTTPKSFTLEDRALDIDYYRLFTGCICNTFSLKVAPNAIVTASFGVVGKNMVMSNTSVDGTITAGSGQEPFDSFTGTITEGGSPLAIVSSLELNVNNGVQPTHVIGSQVTPQMENGRARVTGTLNAYFQDDVMINKFINETSSSLVFSLTDGVTGNTYTFTMGSIKYTGSDTPLQNEQSRMVSLPFIALYHAADSTNLKLVKS